MTLKLSLFDVPTTKLADKIFVSGITDEICFLAKRLGGIKKVSELNGCKYSRVKEWFYGRRPIPLNHLIYLISLLPQSLQRDIKTAIDAKQIYLSTKFSPHKIKFPKQITADLAYVIGLILGDGTLAGSTCNSRGNWSISVCFDDKDHMLIYNRLIRELFGVSPSYYKTKKNYYSSYVASLCIHWFLTSFLIY